MKVTYNWIREYLELKASPQELAQKLTMAGLSVESLEKAGNDWVYDIEVTSNRPDWLSVVGIVHEVAATTGARFKKSDHGPWSMVHGKTTGKRKDGAKPVETTAAFTLTIEDAKGCGLYCGNLIEGVRVGPSPGWLRERLAALGLRSVNNVVDITNFVLLQLGQPLHAFDFDKLAAGAIVVRRARQGEEITLIDGTQKKLTPQVLLICDARRPVAAAGIMGGAETEVKEGTQNILLESAYFDPVVVRRGTRALGVASDSSYRFERGVDVATVKAGRDLATQMIVDICGGRLVAAKTAGHKKPAAAKKIVLPLQEARDILSLPITEAQAAGIFKRLGFGVQRKKKGALAVTVPAVRRDVTIKEDLIEELARVRGYDAIPLTIASIKPFAYEPPVLDSLEAAAQDYFVRAGLKEVITYSLVGPEDYARSSLDIPDDAQRLENFLSRDFQVLRTTLLPSLLAVAAVNINRGNADFEVFETARVCTCRGEERKAGVMLVGNRRSSWSRRSRPYTFFDLKGILEGLMASRVAGECRGQPFASGIFAEGEAAALLSGDTRLAVLGRIGDNVKRAWGIKTKEDIFAAELCLDAVLKACRPGKTFRPLETLPSVRRDVSLVAGPLASFDRIKKLVSEQAAGVARETALVDVYEGKEIPQGSVGLTVSVTYADPGRTLTDEEVNRVHQGVLDRLVRDLGVQLR